MGAATDSPGTGHRARGRAPCTRPGEEGPGGDPHNRLPSLCRRALNTWEPGHGRAGKWQLHGHCSELLRPRPSSWAACRRPEAPAAPGPGFPWGSGPRGRAPGARLSHCRLRPVCARPPPQGIPALARPGRVRRGEARRGRAGPGQARPGHAARGRGHVPSCPEGGGGPWGEGRRRRGAGRERAPGGFVAARRRRCLRLRSEVTGRRRRARASESDTAEGGREAPARLRRQRSRARTTER